LSRPFRSVRLAFFAAAAAIAVASMSATTAAQPTSTSSEKVSAADQKKAQEHFQRAKDLYNKGSYREAAEELEIARKLDPDAKDLVMNLAIVYEKLLKYDEALAQLRMYKDMPGVTPPEKAKAETMTKRIEGAKATLPPPETSSTTAPPPPPPPEHGRVDALTITAAVVAGVGLAGGTGLGIYAVTSKPSSFVTGRDGSLATLQDKTDSAHTLAIVADVGFGVGIVAAIAAAWLYFGRTKDPAVQDTNAAHARLEVAPTREGGAVLVGGRF
jgi:hypothetical protein